MTMSCHVVTSLFSLVASTWCSMCNEIILYAVCEMYSCFYRTAYYIKLCVATLSIYLPCFFAVPIIPEFLYQIRHQNNQSITSSATPPSSLQYLTTTPPSTDEYDDDDEGTEAFVSQVRCRSMPIYYLNRNLTVLSYNLSKVANLVSLFGSSHFFVLL